MVPFIQFANFLSNVGYTLYKSPKAIWIYTFSGPQYGLGPQVTPLSFRLTGSAKV